MHDVHDVSAELVDLARVDLNLLVVLDALLRERHVTRAAARLGLSQSATSHALARLRAHFDDPLLVRDRSALVPTERALALAEPLAQALAALAAALSQPRPFDPLTTRRTFVIGAADYGQIVLLPPLLARLSEAAPGLDLDVRDVVSTPTEALTAGGCDLLVGPPMDPRRAGSARPAKRGPSAPSGTSLRTRRLFDERFVCVVRKDHPRVKKKLDLETFVDLPHAFVAPRGTRGGVVDDVLAGLGRERRVAVMVQHFLVAPFAVAHSDLVITLAERLARSFEPLLPLKILEPPVKLPRFTMFLSWHERQHRDPAHRWLRELLVEVARDV